MASLKDLPLALLTALMLALAGCGDDGGGGGDDADDDNDDMDDGDGMDDGGMDDDMMGSMAPIYINGTVSAPLDCHGLPAPVSNYDIDTQAVPMEAWNRTFSAELVGSTLQSPVGASLCVIWDDGTTGLSGTVPDGATEVSVGVSMTYEGEYSIMIS